jgi:F-type H+-transporting ATPase subunit b
MKFLGQLGIDIKLLIAQIINFGLLLWLLKRFLYRPIINRIEKDEKELEEAQTQKEQLKKEKEIFLQQKKKEIQEAEKQAKEIIKEAESIAEKIKQRTQEEGKKLKEQIIRQSSLEIQSQKKNLEKELQLEIAQKIKKNLLNSMKQIILEDNLGEVMQKIFFKKLLDALASLKLEKISLEKLPAVLKGNKSEFEKELQRMVSEKIGPIVLEYAFPLDKAQEKRLTALLAEKLNIEESLLKITKKKEDNLLVGFRLEIMGQLIENNLLAEINNAINFK